MVGRSRTQSNYSYRALPHERNTDNEAPVLGEDLEIPEYEINKHKTVSKAMSEGCRKNYRCRIITMIKYLQEKRPEYFEIGCKDVSQAEMTNPTLFYYNRYKKDFIYTGLNVKYIIDFLMATKLKENGKLKSFNDIRKYKDAILWGSRIAKQPLPSSFYREIEQYLRGYKIFLKDARKTGLVDEESADPISMSLYYLILNWSMTSNNIFAWFWSLTQWTCMARGISIAPLGFHNFTLGQDSIICKYDDSKVDKEGDKLSEKNIYANPFDWKQCWWTALGLYCLLNAEQLKDSEQLFVAKNKTSKSASTRYQNHLMGIIKKNKEVVSKHIRLSHFNAYGMRKGSATLATSGTTCPPPISSIARRGEWSMGAVLDVYWHFSEPGDHYLGRILAGLDPCGTNFGVLPPHFTLEDPLSNPVIKSTFNSTFGGIVENYKDKENNPFGILLRAFASIIFHSEKLLAFIMDHPGHDLTKIRLLSDHTLLAQLRSFVTIEPTPGVIQSATGLPPHIKQAIQMKNILDSTLQILARVTNQTDTIVKAVVEAIDRKQWESGQLSTVQLRSMLSEFKQEILNDAKARYHEMRNSIQELVRNDSNISTEVAQQYPLICGSLFSYNGRFYDVPANFKFPKRIKLREALQFWLLGQSISADGSSNIKPFRKIKPSMLPTKQMQDTFRIHWKALFSFLETVTDIVPDANTLSAEQINTIYEKFVAVLKDRVSYCFIEGKKPDIQWSISTWANKTRRSSILKYGTPHDKAKLSRAIARNNTNKRNQSRKRQQNENALYPRRPNKQNRQQNISQQQNETNSQTDIQNTERQHNRHQNISQQQSQRNNQTENQGDNFNHAFSIQTGTAIKTSQTIKYVQYGVLESQKCNYCNGGLPSNHYCREPKKGSLIFIEGEDIEICGKVACIECKCKWGSPESYQNRCREHRKT